MISELQFYLWFSFDGIYGVWIYDDQNEHALDDFFETLCL